MTKAKKSIKRRIASKVFWGITIMIIFNYIIYWILNVMDLNIKFLTINFTDLIRSVIFTFLNLFGYSGMRAIINKGGE